MQTKLRDAGRRESEAATAGKEAGRWQSRASGYAKEEAELAGKLVKAELSEASAAEQRRKRDQQQADRQAAAVRASVERRLVHTQKTVTQAYRELRPPKPETLRVLILGASSEGDLRVGRE